MLTVVKDISALKAAEKEKEKLIAELREALDSVDTLQGLLPICGRCKKIRDDNGYWNTLEAYIETRSKVSFSHGLCLECSDELYGNQDWYIKYRGQTKKGAGSVMIPPLMGQSLKEALLCPALASLPGDINTRITSQVLIRAVAFKVAAAGVYMALVSFLIAFNIAVDSFL